MGIAIRINGTNFSDKNLGTVTIKEPAIDSYREYVEFNGDAYVDTGFTGYRKNISDVAGTIPKDVPKIIVKANILQKGAEGILFGVVDHLLPLCYKKSNTSLLLQGKGAIGDFNLNNSIFTLEYGSVKTFLDSQLVKDNTNMSNQYRLNAYETNIILGAGYANLGGSESIKYGKVRIYEFKAYNGDTLVKDLRPFRKADGTVCFKNEINGSFLLPNGGTLIAGPSL